MRVIIACLILVCLIGLSGCACFGERPAGSTSPCGEAVKAAAPVQQPCGGEMGVLKVTKEMPQSVQVGKPFDYKIIVQNLSNSPVSDVLVTEYLPENFDFASADPAVKPDGNKLTWLIDGLDAGASKVITVSGTAKSVGTLKSCANATYKLPACAQVQAVAPDVTLAKVATEQAQICNEVVLKYTVANKGSGAATGIVINDALPENLVTATGEKAVAINVGEVPAGATKEFTVNAKALQSGKYESKASASADGKVVAESGVTTTVVTKPVLEVAVKSPEMVYLGRPVSYEITVANKGDGVSANTVLEDMMPEGAAFVSASEGGAASGNKVVWNIGSLEAGASKSFNVSYAVSQPAAVASKATVTGACAQEAVASASTQVKGIPAILLEMVDISDPIAVGQNETYVITVTNQGSATDSNVQIKVTLEPQMKYVGSSGPTQGTLEGNVVTFAPLASLAPKEQAKWEVIVQAIDAGDVRVKAELKSDQLTREVTETESTNFYK